MRKFFNALLFVAVMLITVSCVSETPTPEHTERNETADVVLRIQAPEGFSGSRTRALTLEGENRLKVLDRWCVTEKRYNFRIFAPNFFYYAQPKTNRNKRRPRQQPQKH